MSVNLQYNYAKIDLETYQCIGCFTCSYEIPLPEYILVPVADSRYADKYYNPADGLFYYEPEYITVFDPEV